MTRMNRANERGSLGLKPCFYLIHLPGDPLINNAIEVDEKSDRIKTDPLGRKLSSLNQIKQKFTLSKAFLKFSLCRIPLCLGLLQ